MIDGKTIRDALIRIGDTQELAAIACIAVGEGNADIQFMSNAECPYRIEALRVLAVMLRELAARVDEAIVELEPDLESSAN